VRVCVRALGLKGTAAVGQKGVKLGLIGQRRESIPGLGKLGASVCEGAGFKR
jgi:hypothetical protein